MNATETNHSLESSTSEIASCMQALVHKESRECYHAVRSGADLEECYERIIRRSSSSSLQSRAHAVSFLMTVADRTKENREIANVAMNYLDRFVAMTMTEPSSHDGKGTIGSKTRTHARDPHSFHIEVYLLVAFDLAVRLHSPFSGDGLRAAVHSVAESEKEFDLTLAPALAETAKTVSLDLDACSNDGAGKYSNSKTSGCIPASSATSCTTATATATAPSTSTSMSTTAALTLDNPSFKNKVTRLYKSGGIYISQNFITLQQLSRNTTSEHFAQAQMILMDTLDFYLHPILPTTIMRHLLKLLEHDLTLCSANVEDFNDVEMRIMAFACYQIELAVFVTHTVNSKPSHLAYAATYNAMKQFLPSHTFAYISKKLANIYNDLLGMDVNSKPMLQMRHYLLDLWEESHPSSLHRQTMDQEQEQEQELHDANSDSDSTMHDDYDQCDDASFASDPVSFTSPHEFDLAESTLDSSCHSFCDDDVHVHDDADASVDAHHDNVEVTVQTKASVDININSHMNIHTDVNSVSFPGVKKNVDSNPHKGGRQKRKRSWGMVLQ